MSNTDFWDKLSPNHREWTWRTAPWDCKEAPEWIEDWIKELLSGEYRQVKGALYDSKLDGFCCLGVAEFALSCKKDSTHLPLLEWIVYIDYNSSIYFSIPTQELFADMNDTYNLSFQEIAQLIPLVFKNIVNSQNLREVCQNLRQKRNKN